MGNEVTSMPTIRLISGCFTIAKTIFETSSVLHKPEDRPVEFLTRKKNLNDEFMQDKTKTIKIMFVWQYTVVLFEHYRTEMAFTSRLLFNVHSN